MRVFGGERGALVLCIATHASNWQGALQSAKIAHEVVCEGIWMR
jgi:hypothetical protein